MCSLYSIPVPCYIIAADNCAHVFLAVGTSLFFLWQMEKGESISKERDAELKGTWHKVMTPAGMELPNTESKECSLAGVFYSSLVGVVLSITQSAFETSNMVTQREG